MDDDLLPDGQLPPAGVRQLSRRHNPSEGTGVEREDEAARAGLSARGATHPHHRTRPTPVPCKQQVLRQPHRISADDALPAALRRRRIRSLATVGGRCVQGYPIYGRILAGGDLRDSNADRQD